MPDGRDTDIGKHSANVVTVFGSNSPEPGDEAYETARAVGAELAKLGHAIANGGYGGTMEAAARGASEVGVVCSVWSPQANRYTDETIVTNDLAERVTRLIELGRGGYVVLPGATGTLVELATVWELILKKLMSPAPLVCVGRFWSPLIELMAGVRPPSREVVRFVELPGQLGEHFPPVRPI